MKRTGTRAANACDYCRLRKSKCDECKPCSNCNKKGIECTYVKKIEPSKVDSTLKLILDKVTNIDENLSKLLHYESTSSSGSSETKEHSVSDIDLIESNIKLEDLSSTIESSIDTNIDISKILSTSNTNFMNNIENLFLQDVEIFKDCDNKQPYIIPITSLHNHFSEVDNGAESMLDEDAYSFKNRIDVNLLQSNTFQFNDSKIFKNLESYRKHIFPFYPIVCEELVETLKNEVFQRGLQTNLVTTTFLLLLALGEISDTSETHHYWTNEGYRYQDVDTVEPPPGFNYFWIASGIIGKLMASEKISIELITIQLLLALYYFKIGQLNDFTNELILGSKHIYKFLLLHGDKYNDRDVLLRLYWVHLHLERDLKIMGLLKNHSALIKIQSQIDLPRGCKESKNSQYQILENKIIYSACFMQNIFLSNIRDKSFTILKKIDHYSLEEIFQIFKKFEIDLNNWRNYLPFNFNWEEDFFYFKSNEIEIDILKLKYYLSYCLSCKILIDKILNNNLKSALKPEIKEIIEKCIIYSIKCLKLFSLQDLNDLDLNCCYHILAILNLFNQCKKIINYQLFEKNNSLFTLNFKDSLIISLKKIRCFSLHSPLIHQELKLYENTL